MRFDIPIPERVALEDMDIDWTCDCGGVNTDNYHETNNPTCGACARNFSWEEIIGGAENPNPWWERANALRDRYMQQEEEEARK